jgi:hypothetical protein
MLGRIFGPERSEVTGVWRKLHREELHNLYSSPDIIKTIKSWRMGWARHVTCMWEMRNTYNVLVENPEGGDTRKTCTQIGKYRRIILKWILRKQVGKVWIGFMWLGIETDDGLL